MIAKKVDYISPGTIDINDNLQEYYKPSEKAINDLERYDIPRMQKILEKPMRIISESQPSSNLEKGMVWFKCSN